MLIILTYILIITTVIYNVVVFKYANDFGSQTRQAAGVQTVQMHVL